MMNAGFTVVSAVSFLMGCAWVGYYLVRAKNKNTDGMMLAGRAMSVAFAVSALCWMAAKA